MPSLRAGMCSFFQDHDWSEHQPVYRVQQCSSWYPGGVSYGRIGFLDLQKNNIFQLYSGPQIDRGTVSKCVQYIFYVGIYFSISSVYEPPLRIQIPSEKVFGVGARRVQAPF